MALIKAVVAHPASPLNPCHERQACVVSPCASIQALPNKRALVISHENVTACMYLGNEKSMLITNCLFRMGGAAVLMSNRWGLSPLLFHGQGCTTCHSTHFCTSIHHSLHCCLVSSRDPMKVSLPSLPEQSPEGAFANQLLHCCLSSSGGHVGRCGLASLAICLCFTTSCETVQA